MKATLEAIETDPMFGPHALRDYALIADGERGALIGPQGDIAWMCAPRWDSPAVFSTLIGGRGVYAVTPTDPRHVWGGYYEPGSLIWRSRWVATSALMECREALAFPGDADRAVVLRRICAVDGPAKVRVVLDLCAGFGRLASHHLAEERGVWTARSGSLRWRWTAGAGVVPRPHIHGRGQVLTLELDIPPGGVHDLVLELSDGPLPAEPPDPDTLWRVTETAWARNAPDLTGTIAPRDARQALAVLRGLTSTSGGMVAAATLGLPERAETATNYDYRYAWIRDQCYAGLGAAAVGATDLFDTAVGFVTQRLLHDGPRLKPAYTVSGGPIPDQTPLDLPGYPGGTESVGNRVNRQFQLDALGEALHLLAVAARLDRLDHDAARALGTAVDVIEQRWTEPEAGIWELDDRCWTHSRLACVAGLRTAAALPGAGRELGRRAALADAILARTSQTSIHPSGYWQRAPGDPRTDAALLLPPVYGALPAEDARTTATIGAVRAQLADDGYVYRYRHDQRPLGDAEGAFLLCGFMMALAEHHQGLEVSAMRYFERGRAACGPSGLFSEEYDVGQRQLRGNVPQAFVHALLLQCVGRLSQDVPGERSEEGVS